MNRICSFILFSLVVLNADVIGQVLTVPDNVNAEKLKSTVLAVVIKQEDPKVVKFFTKMRMPESIDFYRQTIDFYNQNIESIVRDRWTYTEKVILIDEKKAADIRKLEDKMYSLMELGHIPTPSGDISPGVEAITITLASSPKKPVAYCAMNVIMKGMMVYGIDHVQTNLIDSYQNGIRFVPGLKKQISKRSPELKKKTILICKTWMDKDLAAKIENKAWRDNLNVILKVVTEDELSDSINKRDKESAFVLPIADDGGMSHLGIVDLADSRISYLKPKAAIEISIKFIEEAAETINEH